MFRGILSTIYVDLNKGVNIKKLEKTLNTEYSKSRFVKILKTNSLISTNDVINTNNCIYQFVKLSIKIELLFYLLLII